MIYQRAAIHADPSFLFARGDLKAVYGATITGRKLNNVETFLRTMGHEIRAREVKEGGETVSITIDDYAPYVGMIAMGVFGIKGWWYERKVKLTSPIFKPSNA